MALEDAAEYRYLLHIGGSTGTTWDGCGAPGSAEAPTPPARPGTGIAWRPPLHSRACGATHGCVHGGAG